MRRLTLVRYLYESGVVQSRRSFALSGLAILAFHDAAELFLQAATEHKGTTLRGSKDFMAYWPTLQTVNVTLGRQEGMRRLNRARVALKHDGTLPSHQDVEGFRDTVLAFLEENFPLVFGLRLLEVSPSSLVKSDKIRSLLVSSEQSLAAKNYQMSVVEATKAFKAAIVEYAQGSGDLIQSGFTLSPYIGMPRMSFVSDDGHLPSDRIDRDVEDALRGMSRALSEQITVVAYHLDFEGYRYLKSYGPNIYSMGYPEADQVHWPIDPSTLMESVATRCAQFAIDAALRLEGSLPSQT